MNKIFLISCLSLASLASHGQQISGKVFVDQNRNKSFDQSELSCASVEVTLFLKQERGEPRKLMVTQTNQEGEYSFENLENSATYEVWFSFPTTFQNKIYGANSTMMPKLETKAGDTHANYFLTPQTH
ncbi:MAG TPA: SdrD B-like domain-containing protein [Chitinophagaceae bacterium]|nr:SdrD B-like domain-containing protein [Chitinophagaceae bacterium]